MPRYYFDIRDGEEFVEDEEGIELEGIAEAQFSLSIEVRDSNGPLFEAAFRFVTRQ